MRMRANLVKPAGLDIAARPSRPAMSASERAGRAAPRALSFSFGDIAVQAKPRVSQPADEHEQEADRVADAVMRMPSPGASVEASVVSPTIQRVCKSCRAAPGSRPSPLDVEEDEIVDRRAVEAEEGRPLEAQPQPEPTAEEDDEAQEDDDGQEAEAGEPDTEADEQVAEAVGAGAGEEEIQAKRDDRPLGEEDPEQRVDLARRPGVAAERPAARRSAERGPTSEAKGSLSQLRGGGRALPDSERRFFEPRFGVDFGAIRIHADGNAERMAHGFGARAFTFGRHIVFGSGEYRPGSEAGRRLMAHELTHTVQQGSVGGGAKVDGVGAGAASMIGISRRPTTSGTVQRAVTGLAVAGAAAETGHADHFVVARRGGPAVVTAATSAPGQAVRWTGGRRQPGNPLARQVPVGRARTLVITADTPADPGPRSTTIHVVDGRPSPANTAATLVFSRQRGNPAGLTAFGLTDVRTNNPVPRINAFLDGNQWVFRVGRIRHRFLLGVTGGGNTDIRSAAAGAGPNHCTIITDLTPPPPGTPQGPPRTAFWSRRITTAHEFAHVSRFYSPPFWEAFMRIAEANIEGAASNVAVDHTVPATLSARAVTAANAAAHQAIIDAQHAAADAAEIAGAEVFAHGQSNPMYTTLITQISARARPLAPTGLAAAAVGPAAVQLDWADQACNETEYRVFRRRGRGRFEQVATVPAGTVTFTDTSPGLVTGTTYTYFVTAAGVAGESRRSNRVDVTTP
jgi:hypothetical protein